MNNYSFVISKFSTNSSSFSHYDNSYSSSVTTEFVDCEAPNFEKALLSDKILNVHEFNILNNANLALGEALHSGKTFKSEILIRLLNGETMEEILFSYADDDYEKFLVEKASRFLEKKAEEAFEALLEGFTLKVDAYLDSLNFSQEEWMVVSAWSLICHENFHFYVGENDIRRLRCNMLYKSAKREQPEKDSSLRNLLREATRQEFISINFNKIKKKVQENNPIVHEIVLDDEFEQMKKYNEGNSQENEFSYEAVLPSKKRVIVVNGEIQNSYIND